MISIRTAVLPASLIDETPFLRKPALERADISAILQKSLYNPVIFRGFNNKTKNLSVPSVVELPNKTTYSISIGNLSLHIRLVLLRVSMARYLLALMIAIHPFTSLAGDGEL